MKSFFAGFNFARFIILACLIGSVPLGWRAWEQYNYNEELRVALAQDGEVERLVRQIQSNARVYTKLKLQQRDESLFGGEQKDVLNYIRKWAGWDNIEIGQVTIVPRDDTGRSFTDHKHQITPLDPKRDYSRVQLANFFFKLENESSRVKITDIDIRNKEDRGLDDAAIPPDRWSFKTTITTREKIE